MHTIGMAVIILAIVGAGAGLLLAVSSKLLEVKRDPRIARIADMLPGGNCAGCGCPSCFAYAEKIVTEHAAADQCVMAPDVATAIGAELGVAIAAREPHKASIRCTGTTQVTRRFAYTGLDSCRALQELHGGDLACAYSCLGFGDCVQVCPFDALRLNARGTPQVLRDRCVGCGACVRACPRQVIELVPVSAVPVLGCNTRDKGKTVRQICPVGCITCGLCVKVCPADAISMQDGRPLIDYDACTACGLCIEKCPRQIILSANPVMQPESSPA